MVRNRNPKIDSKPNYGQQEKELVIDSLKITNREWSDTEVGSEMADMVKPSQGITVLDLRMKE